ncbi:MAG: hypothetical protein ABIQ89_03125 [Candidatus Saccharimonadales bacterium]
MDKHKQFTKNAHEVGSVVTPGGNATVPSKHFKFSEADLSSDFTPDIDPSAVEPVTVKQAPAEEPVEAPADNIKDITAKLSTAQVVPFAASAANMGDGAGPTGIKGFFANRKYRYATLGVGVMIFVVGGYLIGKQLTKPVQMVNDSSQLDQATLFIDSDTNTVGIKVPANPDGLQVGSTVGTKPRGAANIRMGLIKGTDPSLLFEDSQKNTWQVLGANGSLQFIQGDTTRAKLDENALSLTNSLNVGSNLSVKGTTVLGSDANSALTIQGNKANIPNGLSFNNNLLLIDSGKNNVAIGAASAGGYKLLVSGAVKVNGSLTTDDQVLATAGSVGSPSFSFNNNTNTGIFRAGTNAVGVSSGGTQVLQIQQGVAYTVNGANFEADGFLRAGRGGNSPLFQVLRFTGTLDGGGASTVNNGLPNGNAQVLTIQAFYRGNSNEALPLNIEYVNGGNFRISGGIPGRQFRASMVYSQDTAGW